MHLMRRLLAALMLVLMTSPAIAAPAIGWGTSDCADEPQTQTVEAWLGLPKYSMWSDGFGLLGKQYGGQAWADLHAQFGAALVSLVRCSPRFRVWAIPLTEWGTPLTDVIAGKHDADYAYVAKRIALFEPTAIIRPGWEMNGTWYPWGSQNPAWQYREAYQRVVSIFRQASAGFKFDWCPNQGDGDTILPAVPAFYPGDSYVNEICTDLYDWYGADPQGPIGQPISQSAAEWSWGQYLSGGPQGYGLTWIAAFARQHNKRVSVAEWGLHSSDNPYFISYMAGWFKSLGNALLYQMLLTDRRGGIHDPDQNPMASTMFHSLFSRRTP